MPEQRRLHVAAAFVGIAGNLPIIVFVIVMSIFGGGGDAATNDTLMQNLAYLAIIPLVVGRGLLRWWRFRYWIDDGEFRVLDGAIIRREIFIPFEKIRTVEVNEGWWQRLFGVVRLQVKTGATGTQADLTAISSAEAERLQRELRGQADLDIEIDSTDESVAGPRRTATMGELIAAGATSGRIGFVFAFAAWLLNETAHFTLDPIIEWATNLPQDEATLTTLTLFGAIAIVLGLIAAFLGSIVATIIKYGQFSVHRDDDKLIVRHGLLARQTIALPIGRIQAVRFVQNPLRELTGSGALFVEAVGHAEQKGRSSELFPLLGRDDLDHFLGEFLPEFRGAVDVVRPPPRAGFRFLFAPTLVTLVVAGGVAAAFFPYGALALLAVPVVGFLRWLAYRQTGIGTSPELAQIESRTLLRRETARFPRRAVRSLTSVANIFQRRKELANIGFTVATGATGKTLTAPNLDRDVVDDLLSWRPGEGR